MGSLLIAGIDPGTESAVVLMTLSGEVVKVFSGRNASADTLVSEISSFGKVAIVGTDVTPAPRLVKKIAGVLGARVLKPEKNLQFYEKTKVVDAFLKRQPYFIPLGNKHERDALCAALCSLKKVSYLLKKIDDTLKQKKLEHLTERVRERVFLDNLPIAKALRLFM